MRDVCKITNKRKLIPAGSRRAENVKSNFVIDFNIGIIDKVDM